MNKDFISVLFAIFAITSCFDLINLFSELTRVITVKNKLKESQANISNAVARKIRELDINSDNFKDNIETLRNSL